MKILYNRAPMVSLGSFWIDLPLAGADCIDRPDGAEWSGVAVRWYLQGRADEREQRRH